ETKEGAIKGFVLPLTLKAESHSEIKNFESENIVGLLPGSDPKLKNEYVVLSAHLDHIGITAPVNGDSINNGAMDNASGVATTLEVARTFMAGGRRAGPPVPFPFTPPGGGGAPGGPGIPQQTELPRPHPTSP